MLIFLVVTFNFGVHVIIHALIVLEYIIPTVIVLQYLNKFNPDIIQDLFFDT